MPLLIGAPQCVDDSESTNQNERVIPIFEDLFSICKNSFTQSQAYFLLNLLTV